MPVISEHLHIVGIGETVLMDFLPIKSMHMFTDLYHSLFIIAESDTLSHTLLSEALSSFKK